MSLRAFAIGSIATLYLLIATGTFVCIVHCTGDFILDKMEVAHKHSDQSHENGEKESHKEKGDCNGDKNCSCCNQHGNYVVSENIKINFHINILNPPASISPYHYQYPSFSTIVSLINSWPETHGPPGISGKDISIKFRSLLI